MDGMILSPAERLQTLALRCPICASDAADTLGVTGNFQGTTYASVVMRCQDCTAVYLSPVSVDDSVVTTVFAAAILTGNRIERWTRGLPPAARILCFDGGIAVRLSSFAQVRGHAWVVECMDLAFRAASPGGYDLIVLADSLEVAPEPEQFLRRAAGLLADGGRLIAVVHNAGSAAFGAFGGRHWNGYRLPGFRQYFTKGAFGTLAGRAELELIDSQTLFHPRAWLESTGNWLHDWDSSVAIMRLLTGRWLVPQAISWMIEGIAVMRGRGSMLAARLEKR